MDKDEMATDFSHELGPLDDHLQSSKPEPATSSQSQSSIITVFTLWNTMIGSTVVTMPWAVEQAGLILGMFVIVGVGTVAFYTCNIVVRLGFALRLDDTSDLISAMWGKWGQRATVLVSAILMLGALMAYNVILNSSFYLILDALAYWISGEPIGSCMNCWSSFSTRYSPFFLMALLAALLNMKEKKSYVRLNSKGVYFVTTTVLFMCAVGIRALAINNWTTHGSSDIPKSRRHCSGDWNCVDTKYDVHVGLFGKGFLVTAGVLTLSFFIHNCVIIIMKSNKHPEHNTRDLGLGFLAVGTCYFAIGLLGFFGFSGNGFPQDGIEQNALDMFQSTNPFAFVIRIVLFVQMTTVYPIVSYIVRAQVFGYLYGTDFPSRRAVFYFSIVITLITTVITIVYPNVGSIVALFGAICGLYFIYLTPVLMYMLLTGRTRKGGATVSEESREMTSADAKSFLMAESKSAASSEEIPEPSKVSKVLHCLIPVMGVVIVIFQFVPTAEL